MKINLKNTLRSLALAGAVTAVSLGAVAAPAFAEDWHHGGYHREWRHDRHWGYGYRPYVAVAPGYAYAPPPVVYAPPVYSPPAIAFTFPIHIR